jgi:hypothetical protein
LQQIHPVHAGHFDIQNGKVGHSAVERVQGGLAIIVRFHLKAFGF